MKALLRKLLDVRFSYKLCGNFLRGCLLVKMAYKTEIVLHVLDSQQVPLLHAATDSWFLRHRTRLLLFFPFSHLITISYPPNAEKSVRFKYPCAICIKREINIMYNKETLEKNWRDPSGNNLHYKIFHSYLIFLLLKLPSSCFISDGP